MSLFPLSEKTRNLVRFATHLERDVLGEEFMAAYAFRDRRSRFSVLKDPYTRPGPDACFSHYETNALPFFDELLGMEIDYPDLPPVPLRSRYNAMDYYRSHIEEIFYDNGIVPTPPIEGRCVLFFAETDSLAIRYELRNTSAAEVRLRLRWISRPTASTTLVSEGGEGAFSVSRYGKVVKGYRAAVTVSAPSTAIVFRAGNEEIVSDWIEETIPAGATLALPFRADFRLHAEPYPRNGGAWTEAHLEATIRDTENAYGALPPLPARCARFEPLVLKAAGMLRTLRYLETDAKGNPVVTCHPGRGGIAATWFWDAAFSLLGYGLLGDAETGQGAAGLLLDGLDAHGHPPSIYRHGEYQMNYQQPILAWGLGHFLEANPDDAFLGARYESLQNYVMHWLRDCDVDGSGLAEYPAGGVCWDDSLRWQENFPVAFEKGAAWYEADWGRMRSEIFENADTNAHLYLECRTLARMARRLGRERDGEAWEAKADALREAMQAMLFDPETGLYQDRCIEDGRFTGFLTPSCFLPLYAGIAPPEIARDACRKYLLDPERFYTRMPFPSLDRSHPAFRSGGSPYRPTPATMGQHAYWNGRTWPHVSFWLVGALHRAGLEAEADVAAARILDAMDRNEGIYECYDSRTGTGIGHAECMWSGAAVLALAFGLYKKDPVGAL